MISSLSREEGLMTTHHGTHNDLHSEQGALRGEHPGRAINPTIKAQDLAWLEFQKPDLAGSERFAHAFGFSTVSRTADELQLRGTDTVLTKLPDSLGGITVDLTDPSGVLVRVVNGTHELPELPSQPAQTVNAGHEVARSNATQRPPREPAKVQRLGHVVLQSTTYIQTLNWYLQHLGLIVSDFKYYQGQRDRGPTMSFIRCDQGSTPTDHHTLAMTLGPRNRYVHSAFQVADIDSLAAGGEYLRDHGFHRSWGIGRHIEGSQIFDYWRDPDGLLVEHFTDGDMFDCTLEPGWSPMTASGLAQWGPPASKDFIGLAPGRESAREVVS